MIGGISAVVIVVIVFLCYRGWLSLQHMKQLAQGLPQIQRQAFANVEEESAERERQVGEDVLNKQCLRTVQNFSLAYTITRSLDKALFVHHISGKDITRPVSPRPSTAVTDNMLLVMGTLISEFDEAGFQDKPQFHIEESDLGTHHLEFQLTADQHAALAKVVARGSS